MMALSTGCLDKTLAFGTGAMGRDGVSTERHQSGCCVQVITGLLLTLVWLLHICSCPLGPILCCIAISHIRGLLVGVAGDLCMRIGVSVGGGLGDAGA